MKNKFTSHFFGTKHVFLIRLWYACTLTVPHIVHSSPHTAYTFDADQRFACLTDVQLVQQRVQRARRTVSWNPRSGQSPRREPPARRRRRHRHFRPTGLSHRAPGRPRPPRPPHEASSRPRHHAASSGRARRHVGRRPSTITASRTSSTPSAASR